MGKTRTSFKKGDSRINRKGAPKLSPIIKQIRELERGELTKQFSEQLRMTKEQLKLVILNDDTPVKELGIAKGILKWLDTGHFSYIQPYIEYIFGKPKEHLEHSGRIDSKITVNEVDISERQKLINERFSCTN